MNVIVSEHGPTSNNTMSVSHLYNIELRYQQPDCCVLNRHYWVATSVRVSAPDPAQAQQQAVDLFKIKGKTQILEITQLSNDNQN